MSICISAEEVDAVEVFTDDKKWTKCRHGNRIYKSISGYQCSICKKLADGMGLCSRRIYVFLKGEAEVYPEDLIRAAVAAFGDPLNWEKGK